MILIGHSYSTISKSALLLLSAFLSHHILQLCVNITDRHVYVWCRLYATDVKSHQEPPRRIQTSITTFRYQKDITIFFFVCMTERTLRNIIYAQHNKQISLAWHLLVRCGKNIGSFRKDFLLNLKEPATIIFL